MFPLWEISLLRCDLFLRILLLLLAVSPVFSMEDAGQSGVQEEESQEDDAFLGDEEEAWPVKLILQSARGRKEIEVSYETIEQMAEIGRMYEEERRRHHGPGLIMINLQIENIHAFETALALLNKEAIDVIDNETLRCLILYAGRFEMAPLWKIIQSELAQKNLGDHFGVADSTAFTDLVRAARSGNCETVQLKVQKFSIINWLIDYVMARRFHDANFRLIYRHLCREFSSDQEVTQALLSTKTRIDNCRTVSEQMQRAEQATIYAEKARELHDDKIMPQFRIEAEPGKRHVMYVRVPYAEADKIAKALNDNFPTFTTTVDVRLSDDKPFPNNIYCCLDMKPFWSSDLTKDWQGCVSYAIAWAINAMGPCLAKTLTCGCCCSCGRDVKEQEDCETTIRNALTDDTTGRCIFENVYKLITSLSTCFKGPTRTLRVVDNSPRLGIPE